jgi:hypothetical protein
VGVARFLNVTIDANDTERVARIWAELLDTEIGAVLEEGQTRHPARSRGRVRQVGPPSPLRLISSPR